MKLPPRIYQGPLARFLHWLGFGRRHFLTTGLDGKPMWIEPFRCPPLKHTSGIPMEWPNRFTLK